MQIHALYNIKGGVGKTASAVNLAYLSTLDGARTLIWDLDPQGAASYYFRVEPAGADDPGAPEDRRIEKKKRFRRRIRATDFPGLDLAPAALAYRHLDLALDGAKRPGQRLRRLLKPLCRHYDRVFLDCPPSLSLLSESVFEVADVLLVPTIPTTLSLRTLAQLDERLAEVAATPEVLPFFCMVDRRKKLHREICTAGAESFDALDTAIPYSSDVERMGLERRPLSLFAPGSRAGRAYEELWREIRQRVGI